MNEEEKKEEAEEVAPPKFDLGSLVRRLEDLVHLAVDASQQDLKKDVSFVDVHKQLMDIKKQLNTLNHLFVDEDGQSLVPDPKEVMEKLDPEDKKAMEHLLKIEEQCRGVRDTLHEELQEHKAEVKEVEDKLHSEKRKKVKRKAKYKSVGGKGWLRT